MTFSLIFFSILDRSPEHIQILFSVNRNEQDTAIHHFPQLPFKQELDNPHTLQETIETTAHHQCRKAASVDGIPPEDFKLGGPMIHVKLHDPLVCC